jgi:2-hydroxy-6-oxonona-2,4-dienedioate hydrolase
MDSGIAVAPSPAQAIASVESGAEKRFTPCRDGQMVWRFWGSPEAPPLVLMHGGYGSWMHWIRVIPALSQRYYVIAPDTPGLGESATVPKPYTPDSIAEIVSRGLDIILPPPRRFHLAGFSFGSIVGGPVCRLQGERAISFTMLGAAGMGLRRVTTEALGKREPGMTEAQILAQQRRNLEIFMISDPAKIDDLAVHIQSTNTAQARTQSRKFARTATLAETLPHIKARMHALWGELDVTAAPYWEERFTLLRSVQPDMPIRLLPGIGHWAAYEGPEQVIAAFEELIV